MFFTHGVFFNIPMFFSQILPQIECNLGILVHLCCTCSIRLLSHLYFLFSLINGACKEFLVPNCPKEGAVGTHPKLMGQLY